MKLYLTLSKRSLAVALAGGVILLILAGLAFSADAAFADGSTNALRMEYLKGLGINADDSSVGSRKIIIPYRFSEPYVQYNEMQKSAGFDLTRFKGKKVTLYTYKALADEAAEIHLLVHNGSIIGGDITQIQLNGKAEPLCGKGF